MKRIHVLNTDTGVEFHITEQEWEVFRNDFKYLGTVDVTPDPKAEPIAKSDIHQMNKTALLAHAKELGLKVSNMMTVAKLKETIQDHLNILKEEKEDE